MNEIPMTCYACRHETMVDISNLEKRPMTQVITLLGFECEQCGGWETVSAETAATRNLLKRIANTSVTSKKYPYLMWDAGRKVKNLMKKVRNMRHGESHHNH